MTTIGSLLVRPVLAALLLQGATDYKVQARLPVPGAGSFDYSTLDGAGV